MDTQDWSAIEGVVAPIEPKTLVQRSVLRNKVFALLDGIEATLADDDGAELLWVTKEIVIAMLEDGEADEKIVDYVLRCVRYILERNE